MACLSVPIKVRGRCQPNEDNVKTWTYDAVYPWVPVEIPNRLRSDSISQLFINLRAVSEVLKDLLRNGTGQPLLVIRVLYERDPSGDSQRPENNQRRPSALPNGKIQHHHRNRQLTTGATDECGGCRREKFTSTMGSSRFGTGLA